MARPSPPARLFASRLRVSLQREPMIMYAQPEPAYRDTAQGGPTLSVEISPLAPPARATDTAFSRLHILPRRDG